MFIGKCGKDFGMKRILHNFCFVKSNMHLRSHLLYCLFLLYISACHPLVFKKYAKWNSNDMGCTSVTQSCHIIGHGHISRCQTHFCMVNFAFFGSETKY